MDNELLLFDRLNVIKDTINKYGEDNFYLSFSGGKDSTILHYLIDMALPNNQIPRVYSNTGIEYIKMVEFVSEMAKNDKRIIIIKPTQHIKQMLEENGYPFKNKLHSFMVEKYQRLGLTYGVKNYIGIGDKIVYRPCPKKLLYQFTPDFKIKLNDVCCKKMKEQPLIEWGKQNNKTIAITGIMIAEGGRRTKGKCIVSSNGKIKFFNPLVKIDKDFEEWFIKKYNIKICPLYLPPYNFKRTGCKGCPFTLDLEEQLNIMEKYLPNERKQCEIIWKPVYDEYRRINYRLKGNKNEKLLNGLQETTKETNDDS